MLSLVRPVIFFDLETTGTVPGKDRVVQIALMRCNADLSIAHVETHLVNPQMHIPKEATAVHHITDGDVKDAPTFATLAPPLLAQFQNADLGGYNIANFDIPLLADEFARCGILFPSADMKFIDAYSILIHREPRDLAGAYSYYCGKQLTNAHDAEADVTATHQVFLAQVRKYSSLGPTASDIHDECGFSGNVDFAGKLKRTSQGEIVFGFGKNAGKPVRDHADYLQWMLTADFPIQTKAVIRDLLKVQGE
jgi:DNA polymerase III subunit epsilon